MSAAMYKEFLAQYLSRMQEHGNTRIGAVLEIVEEDYKNCSNAWKMMQLMKEFWK